MPLSRPLDTLVAAINTDFATHGIHARRDLETLILSHRLAATDIPWTEVAGQHSWTANTA